MITLAIAADHAGFPLKQKLMNLDEYLWDDHGTHSTDPTDYPILARSIIPEVLSNRCAFGVLICGTGIGMSIAANRYKGIRAALCFNSEMAYLARTHNDANILVLGARTISDDVAVECLKTFATTSFEEGRHLGRIHLLDIY
ncbi:MAG: ribose 5-phosphate isomerase B [Alphaproteobacteria bacterium]|nr:ribose 5-phosphate isomerase B [Alphaproteobacteria bacterium]OJV46442.1 MAG: ribose 5-phosphate isomerase B [Alphaproteobacteria bacterium 43-37]